MKFFVKFLQILAKNVPLLRMLPLLNDNDRVLIISSLMSFLVIRYSSLRFGDSKQHLIM
jgi:hypothetical protein